MGQQLAQLGMEMARRNMQVQPTLEIRPGYRFAVMVTKDMILRPWVGRDAGAGRSTELFRRNHHDWHVQNSSSGGGECRRA